MVNFGNIVSKKIKFKKIFEYLFYPQIFLVMIILIYSNYLFLPGAFSEKSYFKVKNNHAYMFSGIDWVIKIFQRTQK